MTRWRWLALAWALSGCLDAPVPLAPLGGGAPTSSLAALDVFEAPAAAQVPAGEVVPYDVVAPLWSDGARKRRFLWLPPGTRPAIEGDTWDLPVGSVLVKTFSFPIDERDPSLGERLIETRFLVRTASGYLASTYLWNDAQTDATAVGGEIGVPVHWIDAEGAAHDQIFHVPGTSRCHDCHQQRALGMRTSQLDVPGQLDRFVTMGLLAERPSSSERLVDPFDPGASLDDRARSYLDANCGLCHAEGASADGTQVFWDLAHTGAPEALPLCRPTASVDGRSRVLVPGDAQSSAMIARMRSTDPFVHMPRGPSRLTDARGVTLVESWIDAMEGGCP